MIATFVGLAAVNSLVYAILADRLRSTIARPATIQWLNRIGGVALIGMAALTASLRRAA
jgi:threonine/homoserine/homoserine lactone efflux protein